MDKNPFEDDENPFADPSVTMATKPPPAAAKSGAAGFEDYNPFAEDNVSKPTDFSSVPIPPPQPSEPAVIDTRADLPQTNYSTIAAEQENLARRQEELEKKAAELHNKEEELKKMKYRERKNNFPPFPSFCPVQPCFFHDISVDIPPDYQRTSRMLFYCWEFYCITLLYNLVCALAFIIVGGVDGTITFIVAIIYTLLFIPCSFCLWYRPSYNAFKNDSSFSFMIFFFVLFFQILFNGLASLGISQIGACGFINAAKVIKGGGGDKVVGMMMFISAVFFVLNALVEIFLLRKVHMIYRTTGASIKKAQAEFAQGAMSNKTVQNAAVAGAQAAAQSTY